MATAIRGAPGGIARINSQPMADQTLSCLVDGVEKCVSANGVHQITLEASATEVQPWQADTEYLEGRLVRVNGVLYMALVDHTSSPVFVTDSANWSQVLGDADKNVIFPQPVPAMLWTVTHNMGKFPAVQTFDSGLILIEGMITYVDVNSLTIEFNVAVSGIVVLN